MNKKDQLVWYIHSNFTDKSAFYFSHQKLEISIQTDEITLERKSNKPCAQNRLPDTSKPLHMKFDNLGLIRSGTKSESLGPGIGNVSTGCGEFWEPYFKNGKIEKYDAENRLKIGWDEVYQKSVHQSAT